MQSAVGFTPGQAKRLKAVIRQASKGKSEWIRPALLSMAQTDKPTSRSNWMCGASDSESAIVGNAGLPVKLRTLDDGNIARILRMSNEWRFSPRSGKW